VDLQIADRGTRIVCVGATPAADKQPFGEWIADAANA